MRRSSKQTSSRMSTGVGDTGGIPSIDHTDTGLPIVLTLMQRTDPTITPTAIDRITRTAMHPIMLTRRIGPTTIDRTTRTVTALRPIMLTQHTGPTITATHDHITRTTTATDRIIALRTDLIGTVPTLMVVMDHASG
jgi:hypothetical protein